MDHASIILDEQSIQQFAHAIQHFIGCRKSALFVMLAHYKTLDAKYNIVYDFLPHVLSNLTLGYIQDDIGIACSISENRICIANMSLGINMSFHYYSHINRFSCNFYDITFNSIDIIPNVNMLNKLYTLSFFHYYLSTYYNIQFIPNDSSCSDISFQKQCEYTIHQINKVSFENELLIFKSLNDAMPKKN